nr:CPPV326 hypothetical protein [Cooks petrelpox virus]
MMIYKTKKLNYMNIFLNHSKNVARYKITDLSILHNLMPVNIYSIKQKRLLTNHLISCFAIEEYRINIRAAIHITDT